MSVIVPARNEEVCLGVCLESLAQQRGVAFEILLVDDGSTDHTREIALRFPSLRVIDPPPLRPGWTGKNNAVVAGSNAARGAWLLFTDADTVHLPGSLARSLEEARQKGADLLSYSPEQEVHGCSEKAIMPVIFAELAAKYSPSQVSDPHSPAAAANGQYLLVSRAAYEAVGGHAAVATDLLEDVALARAIKRSGRKIYFRYGGDAVRTRMYRGFAQLREGWTKNLALLFPSASWLAMLRFTEFVIIVGGAALTITLAAMRRPLPTAIIGLGVATLLARFFRRIVAAHFPWDANPLAILGLPIFSYLLLRSRLSYKKGSVKWKGRTYVPHQKRAAETTAAVAMEGGDSERAEGASNERTSAPQLR